MNYQLKHLTIKPFHYCAHHCPYCDSRQELFRESSEATLGLEDWARVFTEADALDCDYLDISGGEPTLYKPLPALIWEAKRLGWFVSLNSTGHQIPKVLDQLVESCLDQVVVSLISLDQETHDTVRCTPGSWQLAMTALELLRDSPVRIIVHWIVSRQNYHELPDLIEFAFANAVNGLSLVYPENDHVTKNLLLREGDIKRFREEILVECQRRYEQHYPEPDQSHDNLASLHAAQGAGADFVNGVYWQDFDTIRHLCDKPTSFALIYANGNVLPCNAVEYTHEPMVGNVLHSSLIDLWRGEPWEQFRQKRMPFCRLCPIKRHTGMAITTTDNPPYAVPVRRSIPSRLPAVRPSTTEDHLHARFNRSLAINPPHGSRSQQHH